MARRSVNFLAAAAMALARLAGLLTRKRRRASRWRAPRFGRYPHGTECYDETNLN